MANRRLYQFQYSYERDLVAIYARISIGAAGAPTLVGGPGKGVVSVTRSSAGKYVIALQDNFNKLMMLEPNLFVAAGAPAAPNVYLAAEQVASLTAPSITIQCATPAGTATDPASGEILLIEITCRNSST